MKWSDLLRVKAEFPINLWPNAVQAYHRWIRTSVRGEQALRSVRPRAADGQRQQLPRAAGELLPRDAEPEPRGIAQTVALTFMGARAEKWPKQRLDGHGGVLLADRLQGHRGVEGGDRLLRSDRRQGRPDARARSFPTARRRRSDAGRRIRARSSPTGCCARRIRGSAANIANRVWSWLLGRGIVHEPDDIRAGQSADESRAAGLPGDGARRGALRPEAPLPADPELAAPTSSPPIPAQRHAGGRGELRALPAAPAGGRGADRRAEPDHRHDGDHTPARSRSRSPSFPEDQRAIALADGSITSSFLELFGRSPRDTGCEIERNRNTSAAQRLHLLNSSHVQRKIGQGPMVQTRAASKGTDAESWSAGSISRSSRDRRRRRS